MATSPISAHRPSIHVGGIRRSVTQPPRSLSFHEKAGLDPSDAAATILYSHPQARIVSFRPPTDAVRSTSSPVSVDLDYPVDTVETLPWVSSGEEILASGTLVIEKIRGSTNFLKSGTKPPRVLMPNSQCWCVDGESTLVMRVGHLNYYRIELPYSTEEDKTKVLQLKEVLQGILRFETTPCPFKRGFRVDLPESATTRRKKGPWKRRSGSALSSPVGLTPSPLNLTKSRAPAPSLDHEVPREEPLLPPKASGDSEDSLVDDADARGKDYELQQNVQEEDDANEGGALDQEHRQPFGSLKEPSLVSDLRVTEDHILESSHGTVKVPTQCDNKVAQESKGSDAANTPLTLSVKKHSNSRGGAYDGHGQHSKISSDNHFSIAYPATTLAHPQHPKDNIHDGSEGLVTEQPASLGNMLEGINEHVYEEDPSQIAEAVTADEVKSNPGASLVEPDEPSPRSTRSPECSPVRCLMHQAPERRQTDLWTNEVEAPTILSQSDVQLSDTISDSSRADSFHSFASLTSHLPDIDAAPTEYCAPAPSADAHRLSRQHTRDTSDMTVTLAHGACLETELPKSPVRPSTATSEGPSTPSLLRSSASDSSWSEVETPTAVLADSSIRQRLNAKRSLSPLTPSSTDLASPPHSPRGSHLTGAILQRARNLALGRPIEAFVRLVQIVFHIAGATPNDLINGGLFRWPSDRKAAHGDHHGLPDQTDLRRGEVSDDDDYGVPIRGRSRSAAPTTKNDDDADSLFDLD